jgi:two-component system sensor kinase FixL
MRPSDSAYAALWQENAELRARVDECEQALRAIRAGDVDAITVDMLDRLSAHLRGDDPNDVECRLRGKDGDYVWIHAKGQATWAAEGESQGMAGSVEDVTLRRLAEDTFHKVVAFAPFALIMVDAAGTIALASRQAEWTFGYALGELHQKPMELLVPERLRERHATLHSSFLANSIDADTGAPPMSSSGDLHGRHKDGTEFPIEVSLMPIQTAEGPMVLAAVIDVTERREIETRQRQFNELLEREVALRTAQLEAANRELDDFAYVASHDLKAPLRVIYNASKWLEEDLAEHLTETTRKDMNLLRGRVRRMERLLDDLLDYARIGRNPEARPAEIVTGDQLINEILLLLGPPAGCVIEVSPGFTGIRLPRMPLQQVLINLVGNAIKHHDKDQKHIAVTVEDAGAFHAIAVTDDGPGIAPQYQDQVFKMFQTLKPRDRVEGSGMGLAVVRRIVELAGGTIELASAEGEGSTFRFTWPKQPQATTGIAASL